VSELGEVREELGAERVRRQIAEERTAALEAELETLREEARELPQIAEEEPEREEPQEPHAASGEAEEGARRSWWRRIIGG
jgi:hypothetical protein